MTVGVGRPRPHQPPAGADPARPNRGPGPGMGGGIQRRASQRAGARPEPPNPRWSRRPPLRFNKVVLPAEAAVSQVSFARGGGWARLSYTVRPPFRAEFLEKEVKMSVVQCAKCGKEFDWEQAFNQRDTPGSHMHNPPGHGDFRPRAFCPHCGFLVAEWDIDRHRDRDRWNWCGENAGVNAGRELPPGPLDLWGQLIPPEACVPILEDHIDLDLVRRYLGENVSKEVKEPKAGAETLSEARFKALREALSRMDADTIRSQLKPSVNELLALANALSLNDWYNFDIPLETVLALLEGVGETSVAKVIPVIARTYRPRPGRQSVEDYYVPGGVRLAQAVVNLGRPPEVIDELLRLASAREVDWCNQLMIIGCLGELGEQRALPMINDWLSSSTPNEPLLDWVRDLLIQARMKVSSRVPAGPRQAATKVDESSTPLPAARPKKAKKWWQFW